MVRNGDLLVAYSQGGTSPSLKSKVVTYWEEYGALATTTREGYTFDGWWTEPNGKGRQADSSSLVTIPSNHTLYANWIPQYTVTFDSQGGSSPSPESKVVTYGQIYGTLATTTTTREGYIFDGWWTEPNGNGTQVKISTEVTILSDHTLYANWKGKQRMVLFYSQGGSYPSPGNKVVTYRQEYGELATTTREGYTFDGWWTEPNGNGTQIQSTTEVTTTTPRTQILYANWKPKSYIVTFDSQGGSSLSPANKTVTYGQVYGELATTTRVGHTFAGWWTGEGGTGNQVSKETVFIELNDQTLYAKWFFNVFTGPSGGLVFYENPNWETDGWRYLEVAPYGWYNGNTDSRGAYSGDDDPHFQWGAFYPHGYSIVDYVVDPPARATFIGVGAINTTNIVNYHDTLWVRYPDKYDYYTNPKNYDERNDGTVAAKVCADYRGGGYNDWFLPSRDELWLIYRNLKEQNLGGFYDGIYWSSSEYTAMNAWGVNFIDGEKWDLNRPFDFSVRPMRAY